jgi:hypothetical protein
MLAESDYARRLRLLFLRDLRRHVWHWSRQCDLPFRIVYKLDVLYKERQDMLAILLYLLKTKKFQSDFRQSVAVQARGWCLSEESQERFRYPLTPRQIAACRTTGSTHLLKELPRFIAQQKHLKRTQPY